MEDVIEPALPPFSDPSMATLINDGVTDIETLLEHLPEEAQHSRLYISANVRYLEETGELTKRTKPFCVC